MQQDGVSLGDGGVESCFDIELLKRRQDNGRYVWIVFNVARIEAVKAADASKKHFATRALVICLRVKFIVLQAVLERVVLEFFCPGIKLRDSIVGAQPEISLFIGKNSIDPVIR